LCGYVVLRVVCRDGDSMRKVVEETQCE